MPVIYGIVHIPTGMTYIGCTAGKLNKRMREHRCLLNAGKHSAIVMQEDWLKDGENSFEVKTFEQLPENATLIDKRVRELYWMQVLSVQGKLYNAHMTSYRPTDEARRRGVANAHKSPGKRWTPEANEKRRQAQLGKPKGHGAKISATKQAKRLSDEIVCSVANKKLQQVKDKEP